MIQHESMPSSSVERLSFVITTLATMSLVLLASQTIQGKRLQKQHIGLQKVQTQVL
jgi:hypothetical protein